MQLRRWLCRLLMLLLCRERPFILPRLDTLGPHLPLLRPHLRVILPHLPTLYKFADRFVPTRF